MADGPSSSSPGQPRKRKIKRRIPESGEGRLRFQQGDPHALDVQRDFDTTRQQRRYILWEQAVAASGVPQYLGSPDDLKLLLMKAQNRKTPHHGYRVQNSNRLSFQGRWYVCPGLLSRLRGREFDLYYDRRVRHVGACEIPLAERND